VGLEEFHRGADDVEDEDDLGLADGLHAQDEQEGLHGERGQKEEVIARQNRVLGIEPFREQHEA
jgi:hypothetical protein